MRKDLEILDNINNNLKNMTEEEINELDDTIAKEETKLEKIFNEIEQEIKNMPPEKIKEIDNEIKSEIIKYRKLNKGEKL